MKTATTAIFSFGSNEMKEAAKKSIGSFLTQTQICSKPRSTPDKNIKKERKKKNHSNLGWYLCTIDFCGRICVQILEYFGFLFFCSWD